MCCIDDMKAYEQGYDDGYADRQPTDDGIDYLQGWRDGQHDADLDTKPQDSQTLATVG